MVRLRNFSSVTAMGSFKLTFNVISSVREPITRSYRTNKKKKRLCLKYFILSIDLVATRINSGNFPFRTWKTVLVRLERFAGRFLFVLKNDCLENNKWHRLTSSTFERFRNRYELCKKKLGVARTARTAECTGWLLKFLRHRDKWN